MAPYRVLVVDDSAFMRKIICDLIKQDSRFTIVATASTGAEALLALKQHKPDAITMDLEMPEMNGLEALRQIMRIQPTPVIMISGISEDGTRETIKALQLGAFDFIRKPSAGVSPQEVGQQLLEKLAVAVLTRSKSAPVMSRPEIVNKSVPLTETEKLTGAKQAESKPSKPEKIARPKIQFKPAERPAAAQPPKLEQPLPRRTTDSFTDIVAVGTSTGGPRALHQLIGDLPAGFPAPVLVVQHMPPRFTRSLAQRLDSLSRLAVVEAEQGQQVEAGHVYIAPGGLHMELMERKNRYYIHLSETPPRSGHRPSVDVLFESLLPYPKLRRHAVIMTGMGSDGAKGMKLLVEQNIPTAIAEAEETCVVFGMPRSAIEAGAATTVLPLHSIGSYLVSAVGRNSSSS
ncbi:chemotaxis response regulator protein-glutamate methylesterase [Paenibacillus sp. GCM10012307]|uniref:Protein-glutamate methylesterase/protein-glutamine glutaminase n=1 Tax=Paenibacillus roseus TaxID=2798579 RepID=A0A934JAE1_9BACL|nr:chemotaxis response regulator protein-glutamate methylesterase [Paenibacillus roseus]MBJ6363397.1 chemotaxis response regulator protein-glutamate methylesterase [Paenibacillus roseus]